MSSQTPLICSSCGAQIAPALLSCPACRQLVHADRLNQLAAQAEQLQPRDPSRALAVWRDMLSLLPPTSRQYQMVNDRIVALSRELAGGAQTSATTPPGTRSWRAPTGVGIVGALLWKFKVLVVLILTKAKLILLGLTKMSTLFSMLLSLGVYWSAWGWKFALGLITSLYLHEMGHVLALRRYGVRASAPMFIPGFGAFVQMRQRLSTPIEEARVGLAGPWWGLGVAGAAYAVGSLTGWVSWIAIAKVGGWITLFNLLPVWQLDGSRGFAALSQPQRALATAMMGILWLTTREGLLVLLALVGLVRTLGHDAPPRPDGLTLVQYVGLLIASTALSTIPVALP